MTATVFTGAYLSGVDMSGSTLQAAEFDDGAVLVGANFTGATLSETQVQSSSDNYLASRIEGRALERAQYPEDLVGAVMFLASPASDFMTGQTILVDGGRAMH